MIHPLHQITTGGHTVTCHPLSLSLPHPWCLPEDGALEVAPLHRNRVCHGNPRFLLLSINVLPPGPQGTRQEWVPLGSLTYSSGSLQNWVTHQRELWGGDQEEPIWKKGVMRKRPSPQQLGERPREKFHIWITLKTRICSQKNPRKDRNSTGQPPPCSEEVGLLFEEKGLVGSLRVQGQGTILNLS